MENKRTPELLKQLQSLPLDAKVAMTKRRIREFYTNTTIGYGNAYVSFSGGKDSTVLLHIARQLYPDIPAVFVNTGLEYPEIQSFAKRQDNVTVVRPKMQFSEVISRYGYPLISKEVAESIRGARAMSATTGNVMRQRKKLQGKQEDYNGQFCLEKWLPLSEVPVKMSQDCCRVMKKNPGKKYTKESKLHAITATMADESRLRKLAWMRTGCNAFDGKIRSAPMSFWTEQDVLRYIVQNDLEICSVYGDVVAVDELGNEYDPKGLLMDGCRLRCTECQRTGCIFCAYGVHRDRGETSFQRLAKTHPRQYEYCMRGGQWVDNPQYDPTAPTYDGEWKNWNPKKIFVPSKECLGLKTVFDMVNAIYGKDFYRYD